MYPAQTSFIPVQIALARFLENQGWRAIFVNYPYWYLGTTPFRFLTGPILSTVLVTSHRFLPGLSLFEIFFGLIALAFFLGALGVYLLVREFGDRLSAVLASVFYFFGPITPLFFRFSDGLYLIAFSILPFILVLYSRFLREKGRKTILCLLIAFVILLDSAIIPTMILGLAVVFLAQGDWKQAEEKLKKTLSILIFAFLISTVWYTPSYWLISLTGPSLAGKGRLEVVFQLSKLLPTALAFALAIFSVRFFKKRHLLRDFCFYWLFIFGFLTLMRFIADPDFWLDWSSYSLELQFGLAILSGLLASRLERRMKKIGLIFVGVLVFTFWLFIFNQYVLGTFQEDITQAFEYKIGRQLLETAKPGERVFLSGTTAFWLNAFFDIPQVRGGVDQASVHPYWRRAAWEIREGIEVEKSIEWLKTLEVSYLVVHTEESEELYHDFSYPEKFEGVEELKKVYDERGDRIYQLAD